MRGERILTSAISRPKSSEKVEMGDFRARFDKQVRAREIDHVLGFFGHDGFIFRLAVVDLWLFAFFVRINFGGDYFSSGHFGSQNFGFLGGFGAFFSIFGRRRLHFWNVHVFIYASLVWYLTRGRGERAGVFPKFFKLQIFFLA